MPLLTLSPNPASSSAPPQLVFQLDPALNFTYCRICGATYINPHQLHRQIWSFKHANTHNPRQHRLLILSGLWLLPDAAHKLASYGIIPIQDLITNDEVEHALLESSPILPNAP